MYDPNALLEVGFEVRFQLVDATHWLNRSAGISQFSVFLGLVLSCLATAFNFACECTDKSVPFGSSNFRTEMWHLITMVFPLHG